MFYLSDNSELSFSLPIYSQQSKLRVQQLWCKRSHESDG